MLMQQQVKQSGDVSKTVSVNVVTVAQKGGK